MAWFSYKCKEHGIFTKSLEKREKTVLCPICNQNSVAIIKSGTISVVEKLDNGAMSRSVERLHNIEEIMNDRADNHDKKMGITEEED
jgi:uncharacterized Zn finger protein (UPF0148 family)